MYSFYSLQTRTTAVQLLLRQKQQYFEEKNLMVQVTMSLMILALLVLILVVCGPVGRCSQIDLGRSTSWTVSSTEEEPIVSQVSAQVPGGIYTDLTKAGVLPHPDVYFRFADEEYKWVARRNWTYKAGFIFVRFFGQMVSSFPRFDKKTPQIFMGTMDGGA